MVAWAWKTRAAPVLHVSTILQTVYGVVRCWFEAANPMICVSGLSSCPVYAKDMRVPDRKIDVFTCVKLSEVLHKEGGRDEAWTRLFTDRLSLMAKEFFGIDCLLVV